MEPSSPGGRPRSEGRYSGRKGAAYYTYLNLPQGTNMCSITCWFRILTQFPRWTTTKYTSRGFWVTYYPEHPSNRFPSNSSKHIWGQPLHYPLRHHATQDEDTPRVVLHNREKFAIFVINSYNLMMFCYNKTMIYFQVPSSNSGHNMNLPTKWWKLCYPPVHSPLLVPSTLYGCYTFSQWPKWIQYICLWF